jgi:hypothetical protein
VAAIAIRLGGEQKVTMENIQMQLAVRGNVTGS